MATKKPTTLNQRRLMELIHYEPSTGIFTWRVSTHGGKGGITPGTVAGFDNGKGYMSIGCDGKKYSSHRLAWLYVHGEFPPQTIDHIDGDKGNNRLANLRLANHSENCQNLKRARRHNKSGFLGVYEFHGKFKTQIKIRGKQIHIGCFDTAVAAHAAYLEAKLKYHPFQTLGETP